ncbi:MAG: electron transport complex subunit RsxB [Sterolibacterium sp.]
MLLAVVLRRLLAGYRSSRRTRLEGAQLVARIDAILPQTQCRRCGFPGCQPYAEALAEGKADINQCPPGGDRGIRKLAALLGREYRPLNPKHGVEKPREVAFIDENYCIGCTLCFQACPVDAIVGAAKQMHTVVSDLCTGCELCVPPCPVDCISMLPVAAQETRWKYPVFEILGIDARDRKVDAVDAADVADAARERHRYRQLREEREKQEKAARLAAKAAAPDGVAENRGSENLAAEDQKKALIAAAIARAQLQKAQVKPANTSQPTAEQLAKIAEIEARRK